MVPIVLSTVYGNSTYPVSLDSRNYQLRSCKILNLEHVPCRHLLKEKTNRIVFDSVLDAPNTFPDSAPGQSIPTKGSTQDIPTRRTPPDSQTIHGVRFLAAEEEGDGENGQPEGRPTGK